MTTIEPLERTIDLPRMVAYAGATWDWHRLHYDTSFVESMGVKAPVVDGQMLGALVAEMLLDHFGPRAFITTLSIRFRAMVFAGDTVRCEGAIKERTADGVTVEAQVTTGRDVAATARATVRVPTDEEDDRWISN